MTPVRPSPPRLGAAKCAHSSPVVRARTASTSSSARRVGSASARQTRFGSSLRLGVEGGPRFDGPRLDVGLQAPIEELLPPRSDLVREPRAHVSEE